MASITLRAYNREIEGLIDHGQVDEAIAHCMHILQFVPKHIGTYRLLGKAFLESRKYSEAADIFQRVLASSPDDFVANIGMSIIREDEKNLDGAIWHMERAFEAQPSNAAIQEELRRLYGRRDGLEPPKVRLTRGALSRMYFKGNLYNQAIGELRAALSDDPQRIDLQVLLAQAYYANGQQAEAVDTCNVVLKKLPFCLEANRILAAILPDTNQALNAKEYQQRLISLDPYYASTSPKASSSEEVPDKAVVVEKLEYKPGAPEGAASQPAWASSLGVEIEPEKENLPDWLNAERQAESITPEPATGAEPEPAAEEATPAPEDQIPEWMKEVGWSPSTGPETPPPPLENIEEPPQTEGELVAGEVPDWLREIAPEGALEQETPPPEPSGAGEEVLPWLQEAQPGASDTIISWLDKQKAEETPQAEGTQPVEAEAGSEKEAQEEVPEWMSGLSAEAAKPSEEEKTPAEEIPDWIKEFQGPEEPSSSGVTDWLSTLSAETPAAAEPPKTGEVEEWMEPSAEEQPLSEETAPESLSLEPAQPGEEIPDWLKEIKAEAEKGIPEEVPSDQEIPAQPVQEAVTTPEEEIPDWLKAIEGEVPVEATPTIVAPEQAAPEILPEQMDEEASLAWLESLARKQGVPEDQLTTLPEEQPIEAPQSFEAPAEAIPTEIEAEKVEPAVPEWLAGEVQPEAAQPAAETPEWMKAIEEIASVEEPEQPTEAPEPLEAVPAEEIPDWLKAIESEVPAEEEPTLLTPAQVEPSISPEEMDQETAMAWLESLAAKQAVPEEPITTPPEATPEETAPWVLETPLEAEQPAAEEIKEPEKAEVEFPDWLMKATEPEAAPEPVQPEEAVPDWLTSFEAETPVEPAVQEPESILEETAPVAAAESAEPEAAVVEPAVEGEEEPQEAALAWLESLARKKGVPEEQLVTHPLKPVEEPPAWVKADLEAAAEAEETKPAPIVTEPEEAPAAITEPTIFEEELAPAQATDETVPSWLISEVTQPTMPPIEGETVPVEIEPVKKLDLNEATLSELEKLPGIGFILAQAILNYKDEHGPFSSLDDLNQVPGIGPDRIDGIKELVEIVPALVPAGLELEAVEPRDEDEKMLMQGRAAIAQDNLHTAIDPFLALVHKKIYLSEVIAELTQALKQQPDSLLAWQTLGDAYVRNNQLQEALDAYVKAEELLS